MRSTLNIPDPLFVSAPNGGGLLYAYGHLMMPLLNEDVTGLCVTTDGLLWCVQAAGSRALREIREDRLLTTPLAQEPLDLHDVLQGPDGVYAVFTETNQVVHLDEAFQVQEQWCFGGEPDSSHVNCLAWHNGRLIASMFGDFIEHRGYKGRSRKAGRVVDVRSGEVLVDGLSQPHSLTSVDGRLWLCSSEDCELHVYDETFHLERRVVLPGYARGLAVGTRGIYVGISRSRNLVSDEVDTFASAVISVLDRRTLDVIGHVPVPWNEIYDIRVAPEGFPVSDVMALLWSYERRLAHALHNEHAQELAGVQARANEAQAAWGSEQTVRIAAEQQAQAHAESAREALEQWASEKEGRIAAEQRAQTQAESAREALEKWASEKECRIAAEQQAQAHAESAREALEKWASEKGGRMMAEQQAQAHAESAREALEKWASEKAGRMAAERQAQAHAESEREALEKWVSERAGRLAAERQAQVHAESAREALENWASEKAGRMAAEQHARAHAESVREALGKWVSEKESRLAAEQQAQAHAESVREALERWVSEKEGRLAAEQQAQAHAESEREALERWVSEKESRMMVEQQAQAHAESVREALQKWMSEKDGRMVAEQQVQAHAELLEAARAKQIQMQGEIAKRDARIAVLEQVKAELELLKTSRSWRWTRPLRFVLRTLRHRGVSPEDRRKLGWQQPSMGIVSSGMPVEAGAVTATTLPMPSLHGHANPSEILLAPQSPSRRDYFLWAVIDWHFRIQRPQHLARELALAGHRVFYVSNNFIDRAEPGYSIESLDAEGRLFQVHLHLAGSPAIYHAAPNEAQREQLRAGIGQLLAWAHSRACASLVQHPYWLETAQVLPNQRLVYDCMDHHGGFADNTQDVLAREHELMRDADLLVVTSDWLQAETAKYNPHSLMVRNACQYEHFSQSPVDVFRDRRGRRVIGYYGAIAEWFDLDLLEKVARRYSDCLVLLVGADTTGAQQRLRHLDNVEFTGEVAYTKLPYYLYGFDVCLLPFQVIPLTLATNPVKVYEYLSAGKDVVSIDLPEIRQFGDLVRTGRDHDEFLAALDLALHAPVDEILAARRRKFAAEQTWGHRVRDLVQGIDALSQPKVSIVVVTYNNLEYTKACLNSLERYSDYPNLEVIVVDNASADDTPIYLREWGAAGSNRQIILNQENRGFAGGNNQGLAAATGDYLVMLNNDTFVTPGWVATLIRHLRRSKTLGMLGPVTNNIGNEARIEIHYADMDQMLQAAGDYTARHAGQLTPLHTAAFFCVAMPRHVYEKVGDLDEAFGIGMFEDDDYCRRVQRDGWQIACADDVFIHHHLSASFNKIKQEKRQAMFERNKALYEAKWGTWVPHRYRGNHSA